MIIKLKRKPFQENQPNGAKRVKEMEREERIEAILDFVHQHPESLVTRTIARRLAGADYHPPEDGARLLAERLATADEETLAGFYYLVR